MIPRRALDETSTTKGSDPAPPVVAGSGADLQPSGEPEIVVEESKPPEAAPAVPAIPDDLADLDLYRDDRKLCAAWPALIRAWAQAYPRGVAWILGEVRAAHAWEVANSSRRKTDRARFLANWLRRAQDRPESQTPPIASRGVGIGDRDRWEFAPGFNAQVENPESIGKPKVSLPAEFRPEALLARIEAQKRTQNQNQPPTPQSPTG